MPRYRGAWRAISLCVFFASGICLVASSGAVASGSPVDNAGTTTTSIAASTSTTEPVTTTTYPKTVGNTVEVPAEPDALIQAGGDIWVASCSGNAVTEISASTKQIVDELNSPIYQFNCPRALLFDGTNIWVANYSGNSLTEFNASNSQWVKTLTGSQIIYPDALAQVEGYIWIANNTVNSNSIEPSSLTQLNLSTGKLKEFNGIDDPESMAVNGTNIWIDNFDGNAAEINGLNGSYIRSTNPSPLSNNSTPYVAYGDGTLWASCINVHAICEFNPATGKLVRSINNIVPGPIIFSDNKLFVVNISSTETVREYSPTGILLATVAGPSKPGSYGSANYPMLFDGTYLWVVNYLNNTINRITIKKWIFKHRTEK